MHLHCLVLDGVYRCGADGAPAFVEVDAPTDDELQVLLQTVITRLMKLLTLWGVLIEEMGRTYVAKPDDDGQEARTLRPLQAAAITCRIAFGPRAGQKMLTLRGAMPREATARQPLCVDIDGFSLHAAARVEANDRKRLKQLCRYIALPALSDGRVQLNAAGQVELKLKTPWRDGTTHLVMSPLEFMQPLAALVPRPRLHLIRLHGVLAPNAKLGALVVPQGPPAQAPAANEAAAAAKCEVETVQARPHRISRARLLKRVCDIDMQHCPNCGGGELKIIVAILERSVIEKILSHIGLAPQPPPRARAREAGQDSQSEPRWPTVAEAPYINTGCAAKAQPPWRCATWRPDAAGLRATLRSRQKALLAAPKNGQSPARSAQRVDATRSPAPNLGTSGGRSTALNAHIGFAEGGQNSYRQINAPHHSLTRGIPVRPRVYSNI
jgi:hypothetical protein